jgi:hypothetical protein
MSNYLLEAKHLIKESATATGFAESDMYAKAGVLAAIAQAEILERIAAVLEKLAVNDDQRLQWQAGSFEEHMNGNDDPLF